MNRAMRTHGTLAAWNDDRGFGFIELPGGGERIFVHISAFPRGGARPAVGELVSFEIDAREALNNEAPRAWNRHRMNDWLGCRVVRVKRVTILDF